MISTKQIRVLAKKNNINYFDAVVFVTDVLQIINNQRDDELKTLTRAEAERPKFRESPRYETETNLDGWRLLHRKF